MHRTSLQYLLIFTFGLQCCSAEPAIKKPPKPVNEPDVPPNSPDPAPGNGIKPPPPVIGDPNSPSRLGSTPDNVAQAGIEYRMGNLEGSLEKVNIGVDAAKKVADIVSAILATGSAGTAGCSTSAGGASSATKSCASPSFKPTSTLPPRSFSECSSYASIISSCASATSSFYSLNPTAQASCACYSTPATTASSGPVCTGTKQAQVTAAPTLAIKHFDDKAAACFSYFSAQGYNNLAGVLGGSANNQSAPTGSRGNQTVLGAGFCSKLDADVKKGSGKGGLDPALKSIEWTDCKGLVTESGGVILNGFDRAVMVSSLFVTMFTMFIFY